VQGGGFSRPRSERTSWDISSRQQESLTKEQGWIADGALHGEEREATIRKRGGRRARKKEDTNHPFVPRGRAGLVGEGVRPLFDLVLLVGLYSEIS
jgi:hypothetical protein